MTIEKDRRSSDFGKLKGDWDIWSLGGYIPLMSTLYARLKTEEIKIQTVLFIKWARKKVMV
jgi:hypothetical protein